jgi:malate dehydrogenase (oxaloacetate-decarboxylating)
MFLAAARVLAGCVTWERFEAGALYPNPADLREVSRRIAVAVVREAKRLNVGMFIPDDQIPDVVEQGMWYPDYESYSAPPPGTPTLHPE